MSVNPKKLLMSSALIGFMMGCGAGVTDPQTNLVVRFRTGVGGANASLAGGGAAAAVASQALGIAGTNGTLQLDDIRVVVSEFELRITGTDCRRGHEGEGGGGGTGGCGKFETPPAFLAIPLDDAVVPVVQQEVPAGIYSSIEFEVENLREDHDDDDGTVLTGLLEEIRAEFPDWPEEASMLATGTFTPTGGTPVAFRVYFSAEITIKMSFVPPLIVEADEVGAVVDVTVDPRYWFFHGDGTVTDLSAFDFEATGGELVEFNFAMKNGFVRADHHH